jgi:hypothetical protein
VQHPCRPVQPHHHGRSGHETSHCCHNSPAVATCSFNRDGFTSPRSLNRSVGSSSTTTRVHAFLPPKKLKTFLYGAQLQGLGLKAATTQGSADRDSPRQARRSLGSARNKCQPKVCYNFALSATDCRLQLQREKVISLGFRSSHFISTQEASDQLSLASKPGDRQPTTETTVALHGRWTSSLSLPAVIGPRTKPAFRFSTTTLHDS